MGNEFSWPCTDRKQQTKRLRESKFDMTLIDDVNFGDKPVRGLPPLLKVQSILNKQSEYIKQQHVPEEEVSPSSTRSSGMGKYEHNDFSETDDVVEKYPQLLITSQSLNPFKAFVEELKTVYDSQMVPISIVPHPYLEQSIVVLQSIERFNRFRMSKMTKFQTACIAKTFQPEANSDLYQEITKFLKETQLRGYNFVGCYNTEESEIFTTFNFVFIKKEEGADKENKLEFETLEEVTASRVERVLDERARMNFIFRGTILIPSSNQSYLDASRTDRLNFRPVMIFEKSLMSYTYHTAEIQMEDLEADTLEKRISKNMNDHCETNKFDFAGVISNPETKSLIAILAA